ncbi:mRNA-capping enzyme-like [Daphnia pulicaria]|uniref:mRNA-capping enzyme-like n=1 Tax=Daphnia pulicaria TaxID=35523 RepID=UPI001EE9F1FA|nr:mRNA-capping enzyme-like [Daphnia pulicaria]
MWPVSLSTENVHSLASEPYVVAPKPSGPRFLLYIDHSGDNFLENMTQHIFRVDEDHAIKIETFDGRPVTDTVLDGIITSEKFNGADASCEGNKEEGTNRKLTFLIRDAIRCNGKDLTNYNILKRITFVREEILIPSCAGVKKNEAFDLDIVKYEEAYQTENYLSDEYAQRFKYPFRSLMFCPRAKGYKCGTNYDVFQWQENDVQECSFRLKIPKGIKDLKIAELHAGGPNLSEIKYDTIRLTEEIKTLDGCIIDCRYFEHQWIFIKQRHDRNHPNGRRAVMEKMAALEKSVSRDLLLTNLEKSRGLE